MARSSLTPEQKKQQKELELRARTQLFLSDLSARQLPAPVKELVFFPGRLWRFDFAWPALHIALEIEGGVHVQGRHTRGSGFEEDMHKYNAATYLGWRVVRTTWARLNTAPFLGLLAALLTQTLPPTLPNLTFFPCPIRKKRTALPSASTAKKSWSTIASSRSARKPPLI